MIDAPPAIHAPAVARATPVDADRLLETIAAVENWRPGTVGRAGERGRYQITPGVWRKYSRLPQWNASPGEQRRVAHAHLKAIALELTWNGFPASPYFMALGWSAGVSAVITRTASPAKADYAQRADNLYHDPTFR